MLLYFRIKLVTFCQEWITNNVSPPPEVPGSLATEMEKRALEEERVCSTSSSSVCFNKHILRPRESEMLQKPNKNTKGKHALRKSSRNRSGKMLKGNRLQKSGSKKPVIEPIRKQQLSPQREKH